MNLKDVLEMMKTPKFKVVAITILILKLALIIALYFSSLAMRDSEKDFEIFVEQSLMELSQ
jgi:competence protein ComGF